MPDHAHLLLTPYEGVALFDILGDMKSASSHIANRALHRKGSIWMDESFDYILRNGDDVLKKARYILENPVRKGLVADPLAWPWYWTPYVELFARS
jgi:REP element-mobilizing transposase RayT